MRKTLGFFKSNVVSGGNKGVSPGTPNIGGGNVMKNNVMLSDAEVNKGGKEMKKIKDFIVKVKECLEEVRYAQIIRKELKKFDSFQYNPMAMLVYGIDIAGLVHNEDGYHFVYNHKFGLLDTGVQAFIILHELGHVVKGHIDGSRNCMEERMEFLKEGTAVQPIELEADAFAAEKVGIETAIDALKEMQKFVDISEASHEFDLRIAALEENVESLLKGGN